MPSDPFGLHQIPPKFASEYLWSFGRFSWFVGIDGNFGDPVCGVYTVVSYNQHGVTGLEVIEKTNV